MNIRPKKILYADTGVKFTQNNLGGANWRQQVFNNYKQHLLNQLKKYGQDDGYAYWLNDMQSRHSKLYNAANANGDWQKTAYKSEDVGKYQWDYKGDQRFGTYNPRKEDRADFNQLGIVKAQEQNRYDVSGPIRTSGDYGNHDFKVDNLYSAITDDRRLLGRKGDWDENSEEYKQWQSDLNKIGWETYLDTNDNYYKLRRLNNPPSSTPQETVKQKLTEIIPNETKDKESLLSKLSGGIKNIAPDLLDAIRLAGNMHNNEKVYQESMKSIQPNLQTGYTTHRQIVGDEATKQAFYKRAAQGLWRASQPVTSDIDRQMAYIHEAGKVANELKEQGDLADNQEIRRTTDESNQHQWANTQRNTEIANNNLTELIKANAAKHQLTAQKYSADWTNLEQFLMGKQAKLEQNRAKQNAISEQIWALTEQNNLENNQQYQELMKAANDAWNNSKNPQSDPVVQEALKKLRNWKTQYQIKMLQSRPVFAKSGSKIEKKYKDETQKYLYKTSRDLAEHFRKIVKMTDDSRIRTIPKPIKLSSHPRKMQLGGVAPFTVYRPLGVGGESAVNTQITNSASSDKKSDAAKDKLDMIKELFKSVQGQGLPIDVSQVYTEIQNLLGKAKAFGEELSTDDIASMYLSSMNKINNLKYSKEVFDKAKAQATTNEALNEYAVTVGGNLILQNQEDGSIKIGTYREMEDSKGKYNALTNDQLLNLRAYSPDMVLAKGDELMQVVNNGVGMNKIAAQIKALATSIGSAEQKIEGISQVESNKIKAGLQILAGTDGTPDGYYKVSTDVKDSRANIQKALDYIYGMLPNNYRTLLEIHSGGNGRDLIGKFLASQTNDFGKQEISPLTGQASDKDKETSIDKLGINSAVQLLLGMSSPREFSFNIGNGNSFEGAARVSSITKEGNPVGSDFSYSEVYKSDLHKNLDLDNACFGDVPINKALKDRIIVDNSTIAGVDLPYTTDKNGRIIPDFNMLNKIEEADQEILRAGINPDAEPQKANEIYAKHGLPIKYGANNKLTGNYKRFAVIQATAIEDVFLNKDGISSNGTLTLVSDENEIEKYKEELKKITGQKEIDMDRPGIFTGNKDIYKGSIFIPIIGDLVDAVSATGQLKAGMYDDLRSKYNTKNYNQAPQLVKQ